MLPRVVWAEESKNGLGFEIGPSHDDAPTRSQCATDSNPAVVSCIHGLPRKNKVGAKITLHIKDERQRRAIPSLFPSLPDTLPLAHHYHRSYPRPTQSATTFCFCSCGQRHWSTSKLCPRPTYTMSDGQSACMVGRVFVHTSPQLT